ncbi:phage baseplate assembly protein V [Oligella urethralis]|uniref:phage baseplate assembly protein V n=1 Tax=Oligella urethralis TaxID=90245 RepID=UPI002889375B|nr:phage baseplate assembly protein V [Oligella urethralis]
MIRDVEKRIYRILGGIRQAFRAVLGNTQSGTGIQLSGAEALAGEQLRDNELFQHYGFTSNPLPGTEAVVIPMGGKTSHGIIVATEHSSYRLKDLAPGEVSIYTDEGAKIVLKRGRLIEVDCDVFKVNCQQYEVNASSASQFNTPTLTTSSKLISKGHITGESGISISGGDGAKVTGNMHTTGWVKADEDVTAGEISLQDHHHDGDSGGTTSSAK